VSAPAPTVRAPRARAGVGEAVGAASLGLALVLGAVLGAAALGVAVVLVQVATLSGWHQLLRVPGAFGGSLVALAAGAAGVLTLLVDTHGTEDVGRLAVVLALGVVAAFGHQVLRRDGRPALVGSLSATTSLLVMVVLTALWVAVRRETGGADLVLVGCGAAVVATTATVVVPRGGWPVSVVAGSMAGLLIGALSTLTLGPAGLTLLAAGAAGPAVVAASLRHAAGPSARTAPATLSALPCAMAALPVWVLARILLG